MFFSNFAIITISYSLLSCIHTEEYDFNISHPITNEKTEDTAYNEETQEITDETSNQDSIPDEDISGPIIPDDPFCPEGMVSVRDELGEPVYCIDIFEISLDGSELGNVDQGLEWPDESTQAIALSLPNVIPASLISWYQAVAACQNAGKYLCSTQEWKDACDGDILGNGQNFPYGDTWIDNYCAARLGESEQIYEELQPTGSHEHCRSPFGTYDQIGNVWEWTDSLQSNEDGSPKPHKMGASYYSGGGNIACNSDPVTDHPPDFTGTIGARCCTSPSFPTEE